MNFETYENKNRKLYDFWRFVSNGFIEGIFEAFREVGFF